MPLKYYAVIGNPIEHSLSPRIHQAFAQQFDIHLHYDKKCIETGGDAFENFVRNFFNQGGSGLNITLPFKERAFHLADQLTERARLAGAVNTLTPLVAGPSSCKIRGDNTDGVGLVQDLLENQKLIIAGKHILILGSGGATKGILPALLAENPAQITIASRDPERCHAFISNDMFSNEVSPLGPSLRGQVSSISYTALRQPFDIIINATPLSLSNQLPLITSAILHSDSFCYDLAYHPSRQTVFTRWAKEQGAASCDGLGMLIAQAAEAFYQWHHVLPVPFIDNFLA